MVFLPHTNTVILLEPYCDTITEPGLPVVECDHEKLQFAKFVKFAIDKGFVSAESW